jgi:hypothetical protein
LLVPGKLSQQSSLLSCSLEVLGTKDGVIAASKHRPLLNAQDLNDPLTVTN